MYSNPFFAGFEPTQDLELQWKWRGVSLDPAQVIVPKRSHPATFKVDPEIWSQFKSDCKLRGVSVCHVLEALMVAWCEGQKATATVIKPVTINLTMQHVVARPRRVVDRPDPRLTRWPPNCPKADVFFGSLREVGCLEVRDTVPLVECWRCWLDSQEGKPLYGIREYHKSRV